MQAHVDGIFRAQGNLRLNMLCLHDWPGQKLHRPLLADGREQQNAFHPCESFTDAFAAAAAEREVGELRSPCFVLPV